MNKMYSILMTLALLAGNPMALAGELEDRLAEARERLDEAAQELAEAYAAAYADGKHKHKNDRAMLGVLLDDCCTDHGVKLSGVTPGGGADKAGLEAGDVLTVVGPVKLTGKSGAPMRKLTRFMRDVVPGEVVDVVYKRGHEEIEVAITTQAHGQQTMRMLQERVTKIGEELGAVRVFAPEPPRPPKDVLTFMDVHGDLAGYFGVDEGVLVLKSPNDDSAVRAGDIVLSIAGDKPSDAHDAYQRLLRIDEDTTMAVMRQGKRRAVTVGVGEFGEASDQSVRIIRIDVKTD